MKTHSIETFLTHQGFDSSFPQPYFVEELKQQLLDDVRLGETATDRYHALFQGGLRIFTTLEPAIQDAAEQANWLPAPEGQFYLVMRIYWPEQAALDGTWTPPSVKQSN